MSTPQKTGTTPKKAGTTPKKGDKPDEIDFGALVNAIKECLMDNKGIRPTARSYNIPHVTLKMQLHLIMILVKRINDALFSVTCQMLPLLKK